MGTGLYGRGPRSAGLLHAAARPKPGPWTAGEWAAQLLRDIGAPITTNNVDKVLHWMAAEEPSGSWAAYGDPLNLSVSLGYPTRGSAPNGYPIFANLRVAARATAANLLAGGASGYYPGVVSNLRRDGSLEEFATVLGASPWAGGHYDNGNGPGSSILSSATYPNARGGGTYDGTVGTGTPGGTGSGKGKHTPQKKAEGDCLWEWPSAKLPLNLATVGGGCALSRGEAKALKGGALIVLGVLGMVVTGSWTLLVVARATGVATGAARTAASFTPVGRSVRTLASTAKKAVPDADDRRAKKEERRPASETAAKKVRARHAMGRTSHEGGNRRSLRPAPSALDGRPLSASERRFWQSYGDAGVREARARRGAQRAGSSRQPKPYRRVTHAPFTEADETLRSR